MDVDVDVDIEEVQRMFHHLLKRSTRRSIMRSAKVAAANVVWKAAKNTTRFEDYTGTSRARGYKGRISGKGRNLRASLKRKTKSVKRTKRGNVYVAAGLEGSAPHAHLVEFGHNSRKNGPVEGRWFMRYAAIETEVPAFAAFKEKYIENTFKAINRLKKK